MLISYVLPRAFAIAGAFSLSIIVSASGAEPSSLPFLKIGARYKINYAENINLPQRVTILEYAGGDWYRCAPAPILPEGDRRQLQDQPTPPADEALWINFSHVAGITQIRNDDSATMPGMAALEKAITDQAAKLEERRKVLEALMKDRKTPDAQAFVDAKRDFETDLALLTQMKLKLLSEGIGEISGTGKSVDRGPSIIQDAESGAGE